MIKLYENGVYLLNGTEIVEDTGNVQVPLTKEEAASEHNGIWYFKGTQYIREHGASADPF